jgi:hypothetical protein
MTNAQAPMTRRRLSQRREGASEENDQSPLINDQPVEFVSLVIVNWTLNLPVLCASAPLREIFPSSWSLRFGHSAS